MRAGDKSYGSKKLFQNASFSIDENEHVGVIGPNGAGKTTLFKILVGQEELDAGELTQSGGLRIGYLVQHDHWKEGETVEEFLSQGVRTPLWDLKALGRSLGLAEEIFKAPIASLSGGYRMRCKLLHLLGEEPDLLLLDEPTNYLDLESLLALERFLAGYRGAFMLISHDREFLRRTIDHVLEVESGEVTKYNGTIDDYFEQKQLLREQLEARALSIEEKRKTVLDFVARFGAKATKARQAQSRLKSLDRLEKIEIKDLPAHAVIHLPPPVRTGKLIVRLSDVSLGYGDRVVLRKVHFTLQRGEHLAVVGTNGAGKSTLLKALAGRLVPLAGEVTFGEGISVGYYAQHVGEALNPSHTVLEAMAAKADPSILPQQVLNLAGALLFSGDDVRKKISVLSGGERSRVAFGQILLQKAPCLLLDEPTNHLDFQTVEALTQALSHYEGAVIVVSHDRSFIKRIATRILEVRQGQVEFYHGSYDEYVWSCEKGVLSGREAGVDSSPSSSPESESNRLKGGYKEEKKQLEKELKRLEREIEGLQQKLSVHHETLRRLNERLIGEPESLDQRKWISELGQVQSQITQGEEMWLELEQKKEVLLAQIKSLTG